MWIEQVELSTDKGGQTRCHKEDMVYLPGRDENV